MKKLLAILLSAMLVLSMVACSNDTPSPEVVEQKPATELDKVNDKIESAESAFENSENITESTDETTGAVTQTLNKVVPMDGYEITSGEKTVSKDGLASSTSLTIEYEENGQKVQIQDKQSEQVTVTGSGDLSENEQKEVAETALTEAKQISAFSFTEVQPTGSEEPIGDAVTRVYEYTPEVAVGRMSRAGDIGTIKKVVITFTYNGNYASYKYDITYTWNGSDLTITEEVTKETKKTVDGKPANDTLKEDLENEFSLNNLQPGGNRYEALNALAVLHDVIYEPKNLETTEGSIVVKTQSGKTLANIRLNSESSYKFEVGKQDGEESEVTTRGYHDEVTITVDSLAKELSFIPFLKAGTEIKYISTDTTETTYRNEGPVSNVSKNDYEVTVVTDDEIVFSNNYKSTKTEENSLLLSVDGEGDFSFKFDSISISGTIDESIIEGSNDIIISKSIINELNVPEGLELGIYEDDVICQEYSDYSGDSSSENRTYILRDGQEVPFSVETLLSQLMQMFSLTGQNFESLIGLVNDGVSVKMTSRVSASDCPFEYTTPAGNILKRTLISFNTGTEYSIGLKKGAIEELVALLTPPEGSSGNPSEGTEEINITEVIMKYVTMSNKNTVEATFDEALYGAKRIGLSVDSSMMGIKYSITFYDGYMKGTYTFSPVELENIGVSIEESMM